MLCAAALALTLGLAGCGPVDGDPIRPAPGSAGQSSSTAASDAEDTDCLDAIQKLLQTTILRTAGHTAA